MEPPESIKWSLRTPRASVLVGLILIAAIMGSNYAAAAPIIVSPKQDGTIHIPEQSYQINIHGSGGSGNTNSINGASSCDYEATVGTSEFTAPMDTLIYYTLIGGGGGSTQTGSSPRTGGGGGGSTALLLNGVLAYDNLTGAPAVARGGDGGDPFAYNHRKAYGQHGEKVRGEIQVRKGDVIRFYIGGGGGAASGMGGGSGGAGYYGGGGGAYAVTVSENTQNGKGGGVLSGGEGGIGTLPTSAGGRGYGGDASASGSRVAPVGAIEESGAQNTNSGGGGGGYGSGGGGLNFSSSFEGGSHGQDCKKSVQSYAYCKGVASRSRGKSGQSLQPDGVLTLTGGDAGAVIFNYQSAICWIV